MEGNSKVLQYMQLMKSTKEKVGTVLPEILCQSLELYLFL
jgi:hypothetical protein